MKNNNNNILRDKDAFYIIKVESMRAISITMDFVFFFSNLTFRLNATSFVVLLLVVFCRTLPVTLVSSVAMFQSEK